MQQHNSDKEKYEVFKTRLRYRIRHIMRVREARLKPQAIQPRVGR